jgi:tRNA (cmo5U34)-methyltransferase
VNAASGVNLWSNAEHALHYLGRRDRIPHRSEGYDVMLELLPGRVERVLDLGCGDGLCLDLVVAARPGAGGVALDFSAEMLERARARFADDPGVEVVEHDLSVPLPDLGSFDVVVSGYAIHHLVDHRKQALYREVFDLLQPGGVFVNVEHVASPTDALHGEFLDAIGVGADGDDPSNKLVAVDTQLGWLRAIGFRDVDCFWKWRELAVLAGRKP